MSKFQGQESYGNQLNYELLPFSFDRFNDDEYILTNLVGEHLIMSAADLPTLINRGLDPSHHQFASLRSKHFIRYPEEQAPLSLLALKVRTRYSRLPPFTNLHIFVVTLRCDHSCPYCQVSRQMEGEGAFDMIQRHFPPRLVALRIRHQDKKVHELRCGAVA